MIAYELLDEVIDFGYFQVRCLLLGTLGMVVVETAAAGGSVGDCGRGWACWASLFRLERPPPQPSPHNRQFTEAKILSEFIKTDAHRLAVQARPPMAVTNAVSWRQEGLFYKKNEVCQGRNWARQGNWQLGKLDPLHAKYCLPAWLSHQCPHAFFLPLPGVPGRGGVCQPAG